ncbi:DUF1878 family protein [Bacillus songklensis]|uniref:DUF1878 family protein n=1 Tax=Bacillus songklensis TaxID=1069116 RepID=A0ABV8B0K0_9BACI
MESLESRLARLEFYIQLLLESTALNSQPFYELVVKKELTKQEFDDIFEICEELSKKYDKQKAEGLLDYTPLLIQFVGMLTPKIAPDEAVDALSKQGLYKGLMREFSEIIKRIRD